jgi:ABC-type sugar transport system permease subunit
MRRPGPLQWLMVLPVQSLVILVIALPSLWVLWLSLNEATYGQANVFVGLENYATLLDDRYFWRAFVNTWRPPKTWASGVRSDLLRRG